jgi:hypothetical protein
LMFLAQRLSYIRHAKSLPGFDESRKHRVELPIVKTTSTPPLCLI